MNMRKQLVIFSLLLAAIGVTWLLLDQYEQKLKENNTRILKAYHIIDTPDKDDRISDQKYQRGLDSGWDPFHVNVMDKFQIHARKLDFHREVNFSKEQTPVQNMMQILDTMDGYNLCEEDWYIQMDMVIRNLKSQYEWNKNSTDPVVQHLMRQQVEIIKCMDQLMREADSDSVEELEEAFDYYYEYYQSLYGDGGEGNDAI